MTRSFDANPEHIIPRMTFEFDPDGVGSQTEFSLTIPNDDMEKAVRLPNQLDYMPSPKARKMHKAFSELEVENDGGTMTVKSDPEVTKLVFGFTPMMPKAAVPIDTIGYQARFLIENEPRIPQLRGRHDLFSALVRATNLQYQFGIPVEEFNESLPVPPARLSFSHGDDPWEPRTVATSEFDDYLTTMTGKVRVELTAHIFDYLCYLDKPTKLDPLYVTGGIAVGAYGRIFSNGHSSYGRRTGFLSDNELSDPGTDFDIRLQSGDAYVCQGHNLDTISQPRFIAMVGVGSIARLCRERRLDTI